MTATMAPSGFFPELWEREDYDRRRRELEEQASGSPVDSYLFAHNLDVSSRDLMSDLGDMKEWGKAHRERSKATAVRDIYLPTVPGDAPFEEGSPWFFCRESRTLEVTDKEASVEDRVVVVRGIDQTVSLEFLVVRPFGDYDDHALVFAPVGVPYRLALRAVNPEGARGRIGIGWGGEPYRHETVLPGEAFNGMFLPDARFPGLLSADEAEIAAAVEILGVYEKRLPFELKDAQRRTILDCYFKRQSLMAAEVGTGKTIMSLLLACLVFETRWRDRSKATPDNRPGFGFPAGMPEQAVVCAPVRLIPQWVSEIDVLLGGERSGAPVSGQPSVVTRFGLAVGGGSAEIAVVSRHEAARGNFFAHVVENSGAGAKVARHTCLVVDEAHDLSGGQTNFRRAITDIALSDSLAYGAYAQVPDHVHLLTATPARNRAADLDGINWVLRKAASRDPLNGGKKIPRSSSWMFAERPGFNRRPEFPVGAVARLWDRSAYLSKADCVPPQELPELRIHPVPVPLARSVRDGYLRALGQGPATAAGGGVLEAMTEAVSRALDPCPSPGFYSPAFAETLARIEAAARFRQQTLVVSCRNEPLYRLLSLVDWMSVPADAGGRRRGSAKGRSLLSSTCFSRGAGSRSGSGVNPAVVPAHGADPREFSSGRTKICLMGADSAQGHSFPLCPNVVFHGLGWNAWAFEQALGRVLRLNSVHPVVDVYVVYAPGTIDELVFDRVRKKLAVTRSTSFRLRDLSALVRECAGEPGGDVVLPDLSAGAADRIPATEDADLPSRDDVVAMARRIRECF